MKSSTRLLMISTLLAFATGAAGCADKSRKASIKESNAGIKARSDDEKLSYFKKATDTWNGNNVAWYQQGVLYMGKERWTEAAAAFEKATQILPKDPMYQMWLGVVEYKGRVADATAKAAGKTGAQAGRDPKDVTPDLSSVNFESAAQHLQQSIKLNPSLWRAYYYLGKIYSVSGKPREAADAFTHAIENNPLDDDSYIALAELYRKWDLPNEASQVASVGAELATDARKRSDLWYATAMANVDKMGFTPADLDKAAANAAIDAFTKTLADNATKYEALYQRGFVYYLLGDYKKAKADLTEFQSSKSSADGGMASRLLNEIMVRS